MRHMPNHDRRIAITGALATLGFRNPMLHTVRAAVMARRWRER